MQLNGMEWTVCMYVCMYGYVPGLSSNCWVGEGSELTMGSALFDSLNTERAILFLRPPYYVCVYSMILQDPILTFQAPALAHAVSNAKSGLAEFVKFLQSATLFRPQQASVT